MSKLKAPLSFQGGKQKVAKSIVDIIKGDINTTEYLDICCGSGAISIELINQGAHPEQIFMVDMSEWGAFWEQVSEDCFDIEHFSCLISDIPENPADIKQHLNLLSKTKFTSIYDAVPTWLLLQCGSFGGKHIWLGDDGNFKNTSFRDYWLPTPTSSRRSPVNPMMPMPPTLHKQVMNVVDKMGAVKAVRCDVLDFCFETYELNREKENVVIFIDPPYQSTTGYGYTLDYVAWYSNLKLPSNYKLFITDYVPHSGDFVEISKTTKGGISGDSKKVRTEILSRIF